jgi:DNA-binding SARP family transcriptional activator
MLATLSRRPGEKTRDEKGVRFSLLGPVRAWRAGEELPLGPRQQRLILAALLAAAGRPVALTDLVGLVWEGDPPTSAVNAVHRYIGALRRLLEPGLPARSSGRWLVRQAGGYALRIDADQLDLLQFRDLVGQARTVAADGDPSAAVDRYLQALGLWHGHCAEDLGTVAAVHPAFTMLDHEYAPVVCEAATAALGCGRAGAVLLPVRRAADRCPLDETLHASLVLVLAADGKQAEALKQLRDVRMRLVDELGVEPGPELRAAQERVLRGGTGARRSAPVAPAAPLPALRPASRAPWVVPAQLPPDLPCFTGREEALAQARDAMHPAEDGLRILAIDGMPGVGKSAFAVHFAHQVAADFPDGQLYMDLGGFGPTAEPLPAGAVLYALLESLGVDRHRIPASLGARSALFRSVLSGRRVLVVLDNAFDVDQVRPLLPGTTACVVMVTSRRRLPGLATAHGARRLALDTPPVGEATAGFLRRVGSAHPAPDPAAVEEIVARCGRLPLALAVVAARAASCPEQPLTRLAAELAATSQGLDGFNDFDEDNGLREVFSWSYRRLSTEAREVFSLLPSQRTAEFTTAALADLAGMSWSATAAAAGELVHARLLDIRRSGRYSAHRLVLAYATELHRVSRTEHPNTDSPAKLGLVLNAAVPAPSDVTHASRIACTRDRLLLSTLAS